ncbi:pleiotropic drug resistance protein 1-like [Mercurialis annua]|uniref:pleiotropic drug resistance protein 1-like n=1 Tax=Mercurialis annua TaxID=3986 RepID=UPI0024ACA79C|nr:pleiotropic drug resistance protein 1-like [Mercurialis annua]
MESDLYRAGSSVRRGNSLMWSNTAEIFSASSRSDQENDEEALIWAALSKLPTYDRLKKGILKSSVGGSVHEVKIHNLGLQERKNLVDRLVTVAEEDNEKFLLKLRNRIDRVGIHVPTIEVRFEHLNIEAEALVGRRASPTFFNYITNMVEGLLNSLHIVSSKKKNIYILKNVSGLIKPSRMTLLLGPPSSGKTTLLLALAGKLDPTLQISGRVTYNGHTMNEFVPQRSSAYISQYDLHIGEMTVRETLAFAARCAGVGTRYDMLAELSRREKAMNVKPDPDLDVFMKIWHKAVVLGYFYNKPMSVCEIGIFNYCAAAIEGEETSVDTDYILKVLGLELCADTLVGNDMLRGISGGQKKRVTTGEMLVGPTKALFMDEISTGLDSSTTYQVVNSIKQNVHILKGTALISLLQPAPETYDLFDDIILLSDGRIVYQGPREQVLEFFEHMGFKCPERKGVADFLQEVTSRKDQQQYWARRNAPYRFVTAKELADAFQSFHVGRKVGDELAIPFDMANSHRAALTTKIYGISKKELFKACFSREFLLMKRNSFFYIFKFSQLIIVALISMSLFLRTEMHRDSVADGIIYLGALSYIVTMIIFNGSAEISMTLAKIPVFYKQRDMLFYPAWAYALPAWILKIPVTFIEVVILVFTTYYVIGFDPNIGRFLKQYLVLVFANQMASGLFRAIAAVSRNMLIASTFGSFVQLIVFTLSGFVLSRDKIKKWWTWAYWTSPMMYGQNAVVINEFLGKSWSKVLPNSTEPLGVEVLKSRGIFTEAYWYWVGVGALVGFTLLFNFLYGLCLTFLNPIDKPRPVVSEDPPQDDERGSDEQLKRSESSRSMTNKKTGMVLPFEPHSVVFREITYSVDMPQEMKNHGVHEDKLVLLKGVCGAFRPGVLTALMGVSGAGKTTLMDVLAGRKTGGYIEGNIMVSGYQKKQETFARISGYCEQNDIHSPHVTVYESLVFSAKLRLPPEVNADTRKMFIEEVIELLELNPLRHEFVGLPGVNGLSTEQRKRLTIAVELVANPSIIFMDEPTSGLDARAAAIVMRTVRNTVDTGRTVVCTIHQPSIDIFESFDELLLLKRGGEEIYVGPLGRHSCQLIEYFEGVEGVSKINDGYNPATWMLEVTTPGQELALGVDFADIYKNSELDRRNKVLIEELSKPVPGSSDLYFPTKYSQPFLNQCLACLWKQNRSYWCNPRYTAVKLIFTIFTGLILGTMFWDLGMKTTNRQDLFNAMGSMFVAVMFLGSQNGSNVQPVVAVERTVFYRERAAGMYSAMAYAFAQAGIEIPYVFVQAIFYGVIAYAMMGFEWSANKFFWYMFFTYFTFLFFTFYGMMVMALSPNQHVAAIISAAIYGMWNLFSGFIIPQPRMPVWWRWFYWICPVAWSLNGLVTSQYGDLKTKLDTGETVESFVRNYFGFKHELLGAVAVIVLGFVLLYAFIFAVSIKIFNFQKR